MAATDENLAQQISRLRKILGDRPNERRFIVTVPGVGYKFVADVRETFADGNGFKGNLTPTADESSPDETHLLPEIPFNNQQTEEANENDSAAATASEGFWRSPRKNDWRILVITVVVFSIIGLTAVFFWQNYKSENVAPLGARKIAVLPFKAVSEDEQTLAIKRGMTDEVITRLSRLDKLTVLPSSTVSRFDQPMQDPLVAGRELGADAVFDGRIQKEDKKIRVTAQLIRTSDGKVLWSEIFLNDLTDIFDVQRLIAHKITEALALELSDEEKRAIMKRYTTSAEAYRLFLDANHIQNYRKGSEARMLAEKNYEKAIELDPKFALAYVQLANLQLHAPSQKAYTRMKTLSEQALAIDETLGEAHEALGFALWRGDWNWTDAEKHFKRGIELNRKVPENYWSYSLVLAGQGKFDEAINVIESDESSNDNSVIYKIAIYFFRRDYDKTVQVCRQRLASHPNDVDALSYLSLAYSQIGMHAEAIETAKQYAAFDETADIGSLVYLSYAYIKAGQTEKGREILRQILEKDAPPAAQIHGGLAMLYGELGEKNKAFEHLEKSIENREWWAFTLKVAPYYDSLRSDERFAKMLRRVNLAE